LLTINCEPKGDKKAHFLVTPATGDAAPIQLRCKGVADVGGPGPWVVRPADDTVDKIKPGRINQSTAAYAVFTYLAAELGGDYRKKTAK
jgi:hypothetical protein